MKIRSGFVSNSSSSSFIIALNDSVPCQYCGRSDKNILDVIGRLSGSGSSDSKIHWEDPTDYIYELQKEINDSIKELEGYDGLADDHVIIKKPFHTEYRYIVADLRRYAQTAIDDNVTIISDINKQLDLKKDVVRITIDYNDELLNDMFSEQCDNGTLTLIFGG